MQNVNNCLNLKIINLILPVFDKVLPEALFEGFRTFADCGPSEYLHLQGRIYNTREVGLAQIGVKEAKDD